MSNQIDDNVPKGKVLILRAMPWGADSRAIRWAMIYAPREVGWGCWGSTAPEHQSYNILNRRPSKGFFSFTLGYIAFIFTSFFFALKHLRRHDILLCIDLETALLGNFAAWLRGARVHYDMADPFYLAKPMPFKALWRWLERCYIERAHIATAPIASRFQLFFGDKLPKHCSVVENVPQIPENVKAHDFFPMINGCRILTFGYFGTLEEHHRGIEDIVYLVRQQANTRLIVGGRGALANWVEHQSRLCERIKFVGEYQPEELIGLTHDVDVYCSLYYRSKPLHLFAAPNKYYEHLALEIPLLISVCTPFASEVNSNRTGWAVEDGFDALQIWYKSVIDTPLVFEQAAANGRRLWADRYANWLQQQSHFFSAL